MFKNKLIFLLIASLLVAVYFLRRKSGTTEIKQTVINNVELVKQIAELSSLEVTGHTSVKLTNLSDRGSWWNKVKDYLTENTLQVTIPYEAKYGIDLNDKQITTKVTDTIIEINLPKCKLLSLQLLLNKLETMNQTGLLASTSIQDLAQAEQQLYNEAMAKLSNDNSLIQQAQQHIKTIFAKYYKPLGMVVDCKFAP